MPKFNCSKASKIYIFAFTLFITLFLLLSFSFISKESLTSNNKKKNLRKLGGEIAGFII